MKKTFEIRMHKNESGDYIARIDGRCYFHVTESSRMRIRRWAADHWIAKDCPNQDYAWWLVQ